MRFARHLIATACAGLIPAAAGAGPDRVELAAPELQVRVNLRGAQLSSVRQRSDAHEYLWQNQNGAWDGPAPILFPVVGALRTKSIRHAGREIPMAGHGFARRSSFAVTEQGPDRVTLELRGGGNPEFPWPFRLAITYRLKGRTLVVEGLVENTGEHPLPFALGFHPGFNATIGPDEAPARSTLTVTSRAPLRQLQRNAGSSFLNGERRPWDFSPTPLPVTHGFAIPPATVLACEAPVEVRLDDHATEHRVTLRSAAPFLTLWRIGGAAGQFICLEPCWGTTDPEHDYGDFTAKPHLQLLAPGGRFHGSFSLTFE